jgi:hypothetical protein
MKFDPFAQFAQWGKMFETWQKLSDDSMSRTTAFFAEIDKAEAKRVQQAESAIEEMAKLQKETIAYSARIGGEMRKLSLEAFQTFVSANAA